jgi:hypothetical protein
LESFIEKKDEPQAPVTRSAKAAVRSIRIFEVLDFVVFDRVGIDFMEDLMGANRTTFEGGRIRLVG